MKERKETIETGRGGETGVGEESTSSRTEGGDRVAQILRCEI